ncbi:hypothetical protein AX15_007906 [Amanita polypyramis BW_CC]|nr:hypothetical protein AX15_007906 [Amanita polypyramis BW_CC]
MLSNSIEGFTPSKCKLALTACGIKQKANRLNKVKNTGMCWITGTFSTTPIAALEVISYTPPILAQLNIMVLKYALCINKLAAIHPI